MCVFFLIINRISVYIETVITDKCDSKVLLMRLKSSQFRLKNDALIDVQQEWSK